MEILEEKKIILDLIIYLVQMQTNSTKFNCNTKGRLEKQVQKLDIYSSVKKFVVFCFALFLPQILG